MSTWWSKKSILHVVFFCRSASLCRTGFWGLKKFWNEWRCVYHFGSPEGAGSWFCVVRARHHRTQAAFFFFFPLFYVVGSHFSVKSLVLFGVGKSRTGNENRGNKKLQSKDILNRGTFLMSCVLLVVRIYKYNSLVLRKKGYRSKYRIIVIMEAVLAFRHSGTAQMVNVCTQRILCLYIGNSRFSIGIT